MLLRNSKTGGFEVYDISNNNITNAGFLGNVGLDWQVMSFGNFSSRGEGCERCLPGTGSTGQHIVKLPARAGK
jgi:hypothetical protein